MILFFNMRRFVKRTRVLAQASWRDGLFVDFRNVPPRLFRIHGHKHLHEIVQSFLSNTKILKREAIFLNYAFDDSILVAASPHQRHFSKFPSPSF